MKSVKTYEEFLNENKKTVNEGVTDEIELILAKDEDKDRVMRAYRNEKDLDLHLTKWSSGYPLGSARGMLVSLYFASNKSEVETFIKKNNIKVANATNFDLNEGAMGDLY